MKFRPPLRRSTSYNNLKDLLAPTKTEHVDAPDLKKALWNEIAKPQLKNPRGAEITISRELAEKLDNLVAARYKDPNTELSMTPELVMLCWEELHTALKTPAAKLPKIKISTELATRIWNEFGPEQKYTASHLDHSSDLDHMNPRYAELISEEIGPRVVHLTAKHHLPDFRFPKNARKVTVVATGCGGDEGEAQVAVADALDEFIGKHRELNFLYAINTGDNFYTKGVDSPTHPDFQKKFYEVYFNPKYRYLRDLSFLMTLGNHDGNRRKVEYYADGLRPIYMPVLYAANLVVNVDTSTPATGRDAEKNQVMHMHFPHPEDTKLPVSTREKFQEKRVDVSELRKFDMEYYHTSKVDPTGKFQYFFVNSNTLLQDYLAYLAHISKVDILSPEDLRKNQVAFLLEEYPKCKAAGRIPILVQHHPFIPMGDRAYPKNYDSLFYLYADQIARLDLLLQLPREPREEYLHKVMQILIAKKDQVNTIPDLPLPTVDAQNYCVMLARFFASLGMDFTMLVCAHDHMLAYRNSKGIQNVSKNYKPGDPNKTPVPPPAPRPDDLSHYRIRQLTTGGGGGKLQNCDVFSQFDDLGFCMKDNGFLAFTLDPDNPDVIEIHVMTIKHTEKMIKDDHRRPWEDNLYMRFNTRSSAPIREVKVIDANDKNAVEDRNKVETLTQVLLNACRNYYKFLDNRMGTQGEFLDRGHITLHGWMNHNNTHKRPDIIIMHKIMNYLNQYKRTNYAETVAELHELTQLMLNKTSSNALLKSINDALKTNKFLGGKTLEKLYDDVQNAKGLAHLKNN